MILNAYAVLDAFLSVVRLIFGIVVIGLSISACRRFAPNLAPEAKRDLEDRSYLLFLLAIVLLGLNVVSWPVFYLLLQSYVSEWPGTMCIYGVTQIGMGSIGPSRFLPALITTLQIMKPALVFASGAWLVLYLLNRSTHTSPLLGRLLGLVCIVGLLAVGDAVIEETYLVIPKKEEFLSVGCCTAAFDEATRPSRVFAESLAAEDYDSWLEAAYFGVNAGTGLLLLLAARPHVVARFGVWLAFALSLAVLSLPLNAVFLIEVAAPRLLHLPLHHCPYDLLPQVPESMIGIALFFVGCFAVGWAAVVAWLGVSAESRPFQRALLVKCLVLGGLGYLGSLTLVSVELLLART